MKPDQIKTQNSHIRPKVDIRLYALPDRPVTVLDCYSGNGILWKMVQKQFKHKITTTRIDIGNYDGVYLKGNNIKFLQNLPLGLYDFIDLDAYGIPFKQMEYLFQQQYKGTIFVTFIQSMYGQINHQLLKAIGYTDIMIKKIPSLFMKNGFDKLKQYLAVSGIKKIKYISIQNKHYLQICPTE